ncbi:MAG: tRNA adenosine(34) deaminase TadA [Bdellovibrionales bacterium]|nr:tRNA adenosine(34) deaminase TadA [Bdellovibrionales bacterium]
MSNQQKWMNLAIEMALKAKDCGEVPVGAVIIHKEAVIAQSHNLKESSLNPIFHAEILAIQLASQKLGRWRLNDCQLYVTLEPCLMCSGAIIQARLELVSYGTPDPKGGAVHSLYQVLSDQRLNHNPRIESGLLEKKCSQILTSFFQERRLSHLSKK